MLKEEQTIGQLAAKYQITAKSIQNWKKQFLENAAIAMEPAKAVSEYKSQLESKDQKIGELQKALGKATIKAQWAEGKLKSLDYKTKKVLVKSELHISIQDQCNILDISRSSFYYISKPMSANNLQILNAMDEIYTDNPEYGYRYIHQQLLEDWSVNGKTKTVHVPTANEVWSGDITYIRTNGGFMYLATIIDWHSKAILSYKISNSMDVTLATDVLKDALTKYPKPKIFNSDQGSQYTSYEHTKVLKDNDIQISMNGKVGQ